jgi:hypothetical protein
LHAMDEICDFHELGANLWFLYRHSILFLRKIIRLDDTHNHRSNISLWLHASEGKRGRVNKKYLIRLTFWEKLEELTRPIYWDGGSSF